MKLNFLRFALLSATLLNCTPCISAAPSSGTNSASFTELFHGTAYYPELWPEEDIDRDVAEMKKLGINVVRIGEFAWATMEPQEGKVSMESFRRVMDKLHDAGIGVVLCTPTATPPIWLTDGHPERSFVDENGTVMVHGARQHVSYENPEVRAACLGIVREMAKQLGRHPALVAWQIDNELKCHVGEDFNKSAVDHWHKWLEGRYGTIGKLNEAWGTDIWSERYNSFDQVPAPRKTPFAHNASLSTAYRLFSRESIADFMDDQSAVIREFSSAPITHNMNLGFSVNFERMSRNLDFVSFDDYPGSDHWSDMVLDCDFFRSAKPGKPFWLMETSTSFNGWLGNSKEAPHPPGFLVAEAVSAYALGSQSVSYWLWRQQRAGAELPHSAIMSAWFKPGLGYSQVCALEQARKKLEPIIQSSKPAPAEAAVTWSDRGRAMIQTEPLGNGKGYKAGYNDTIAAWHALLLDAGIHREILFEGADIPAGLKLLVTPAMPAVTDEFLKKVGAWVSGGGVWICGPLTGTRTPEHTVPTDAGLGPVEKMAGVETVFSFPVNGSGSFGEAFGIKAPLAGWCSALKPGSGETKVIGKIISPLIDQPLAFLTERKIGKGSVLLLGAQPDGDQGRRMLTVLIARAAVQSGIKDLHSATPGTIICPRITGDGHSLWIVVNMDGKGGAVKLTKGAVDAFTSVPIAEGTVKIDRYGWRAFRW